MSSSPAFAPSDEVLTHADTLTEDELDQLPSGMIQLSRDGTILKFNAAEAQLGGVAKQDAVGRSFFDEIAPCTKVKQFHGQFLAGVERQELHTLFPYEFKFRDGRRKNVVISMFYSSSTETVWVMVQRP